MRLRVLYERLRMHTAKTSARAARERARDQLFPLLSVTRLEERRLLNAAPVPVGVTDQDAAVAASSFVVPPPDGNVSPGGGAAAGDNQAPTNTLPAGPLATNEDTALVINGISVADPDSGASPIVTRFEVAHGTLTVDASIPGAIVLGNGTNILQIVGSTTQINDTLAQPTGLTYQPAGNYSGPDTLTMVTNDLGSTGNGGPLTDTDTVGLSINPINDAPVNSLPVGPLSTNEDTALAIGGISVSDPDSGATPIVTRFEVAHGTLSVDASVPGVIVLGNGTNILQIIGTTTQINDTLAKPTGLTYLPDANYNGSDTVTMVTNDLGGMGAGGPLKDTDTLALVINPINDAPVNTLPSGPLATSDNTALAIGGISVSDVDSGASSIVTRFEVAHGTLTVDASVPGVIVLGNGTNILQIIGTVTQINDTLAKPTGLTYLPAPAYEGPDTLLMVTNDLGATGIGGPLKDTDTLGIVVSHQNQAPVNTLPAGPLATNEDTALVIAGVAVSDADSGASPIVTRFEVAHGTLTVDTSVPGVTVLGNGTNILQIVGTVAQINDTLAKPTGLTYQPDGNYNGPDSLLMVTNDLGATGIGGPLQDTDTLGLIVNPVNDAPVNTLPGPLVANEDTPLVIGGIAVSDVDSGASPIVTRFEVAHGTLTVDASVPGVIVLGNGTNILQIIGTVAQINETLAKPTGLTYLPANNYGGPDALTMVTNDLGAMGAGGPLKDTDTVGITDVPVADVPGLVVASPVFTFAGTPVTLSIAGQLADTDGSEVLSFTVSNVPTTAVLRDGLGGVHTGLTSYAFSPAEIAGLTITMPIETGASKFDLSELAIATETANLSAAASPPGTINVTILIVNPTLTPPPSFVAPPVTTQTVVPLAARSDLVAILPIVIPSNTIPVEWRRTVGDAVAASEAHVLLNVVDVVTGEEHAVALLPVSVLDNLQGLLSRLPDGHYRVYYEEPGVHRLVTEVMVRRAKPVDPMDDSEGTQDRPPTARKTQGEDQPGDGAGGDGDQELEGAAPGGDRNGPNDQPDEARISVPDGSQMPAVLLSGNDPHGDRATSSAALAAQEGEAPQGMASARHRRLLIPAMVGIAAAAAWNEGRSSRNLDEDLAKLSVNSMTKAARLGRRLRRALAIDPRPPRAR